MTDQEPGGRMSAQSQSLYRKYRPRSFAQDELVGQEHIARTLQNAIELDRVAHAYLFCGPRGTGKTSTARLLAKAVNCDDPDPHNRPCNACAPCRAINTGATVDIIEIDAASNRGVDDIRDLREKVKYAPAQLRVKFYIIDEAHQLTRDAFNAFLKTLEEPPPHVRFVLATTEADKLPDTVASRCQRFDFRRIPVAQAIERLRTVAQLEGLDVEEEALRLIARQATGSLRDALGLLDQLALFGESGSGRRTVTADSVRAVLGLSRNDRLEGLVDALASRDPGAGLRLIAEAAETGEDVHQLNRQLVGYLRTLMHLRAGSRSDGADATARRQAEQFSLAELAGLVRIFSAIDGSLNKGSYAQLPLEIAFVEAVVGTEAPQPAGNDARQSTAAPVEPAPSHVVPETPTPPRPTPHPTPRRSIREDRAGAEARVPEPAGKPVGSARPQPERTPASAPSSADLERLVAGWAQIKRDIKLGNSRIAALLGSVDPVAVNGAEIILVAPYEFHRNKLNEDTVRRMVEDVASQHLGGSYRITCLAPDEYVPTPDTGQPDPEPDQPQAERDSSVENDEQGPDPDDERRIRATKSIFEAEEIT